MVLANMEGDSTDIRTSVVEGLTGAAGDCNGTMRNVGRGYALEQTDPPIRRGPPGRCAPAPRGAPSGTPRSDSPARGAPHSGAERRAAARPPADGGSSD